MAGIWKPNDRKPGLIGRANIDTPDRFAEPGLKQLMGSVIALVLVTLCLVGAVVMVI